LTHFTEQELVMSKGRTRIVAFIPLLTLGIAGCNKEPSPPPNGEPAFLEPPGPGEGIQFVMTSSVDPGTEAEHCQFFRVPDDGLTVNRVVTKFRASSHHVLMYETPYDAVPTENDRGEAIDTSGVFDCTSGATNGWSVLRLVGGSQNADGDGPVEFPEGVGMHIRPGAVLLMNLHVVNPGSESAEPEVRMNFYTVPPDELEIEGGVLFWYNDFIRVPENGTATAKMSCAVPEAITLATASSHMHRRGVGFGATAFLPGGEELPVFATDTWEGVPVDHFPDGLEIPAGTRIEYFCDYENAEPRTVWQGPRSTDEMCMLVGAYYPAKPYIGNCAIDAETADETGTLGADWVGDGDATCAQTLNCLGAIDPTSDYQQALTTCVLDASPAVSAEVSDLVRCALTHADPVADCAAEISLCQEN
jgi:hypothetical protein